MTSNIPEIFREAVKCTDHTALGEVDIDSVTALCREAATVNPFPNSVCIQGAQWCGLAHDTLTKLDVRNNIQVCGVGMRQFPLEPIRPFISGSREQLIVQALPGQASLEDKLDDLTELIDYVDLFDMVLNVRQVLENRLEEAVREIKALFKVLEKHKDHPHLRVICSTALLRDVQGDEGIHKACMVMEMARSEGGELVMKTETGFVVDREENKYGATLEDIQLMRSLLPESIGIKASGGVSQANALSFLEAGANYLGASGFLRSFIHD